ncbi:MAG: hypothetical protein WBD15_19550 [Pseudolabrys sp.]
MRISVFLQLNISRNRFLERFGSVAAILTVQTPTRAVSTLRREMAAQERPGFAAWDRLFALFSKLEVRTYPALRQVWPTRSG